MTFHRETVVSRSNEIVNQARGLVRFCKSTGTYAYMRKNLLFFSLKDFKSVPGVNNFFCFLDLASFSPVS